ncbi:MAG: carboxypeptidase-like regulatory domain-containing protein [Bacteroidetes bacterium]|nr:MAG: carboxypeptidase-like regulatory domain-containing protein [Bacteroidota bacterium]
MIRYIVLAFFLFFIGEFHAQQTKVRGQVTDAVTGEVLPFVTVRFHDSKIATLTDSVGRYSFETYYATDSLRFSFSGYLTVSKAVKLDEEQVIDVKMETLTAEIGEVTVRPPDEFPSTTLHKKVIRNKDINNKEKLESYEYELYNKIQLDVNNLGERFQNNPIVKRLDLVMSYLDSADNGKNYLPLLLSESISNFYFKNNPKKKREVITASKLSGVDNFQINQLLGDMYLDMNIYDNYITLFQRAFVSPVANFARTYYRFYLEDSTFIDNQWCYKLRFKPKRSGDMTFEGEMWIHDTTYAVKQISARIAPWANINYVQDLYFEHHFDQVEKEVWMLTKEKMIADLKLTKKTKVYGFYARKLSSRKKFVINEERPPDFYQTNSTVEYTDGAQERSEAYWDEHRHEPLSKQEKGINEMIDSLEQTSFFTTLKNGTYLLGTGYWPLKKLELGSIYSLASINPVEGFRTGLALRTSNKFSRIVELGGRVAYGVNDERFKYGALVRWNVTPKKRGMLSVLYNYDIEQIGQSPTAASVSSTFGTVFRTGPLDKLTFVEKVGVNLEKDVKKDLILFGGIEWKEYTPLGLANYQRYNSLGVLENISRIQTAEVTARIRWTKDEEFISGAFDRTTLRSKYPIFSVQGIFGIKGLLGSDYNYQKVEFQMEHNRHAGVLGRIRYGVTLGNVFGTAAYPFLKVHAGNQSYWLLTTTFNKLNFFEFVSDRYTEAFIEHHWEGLFLDRIPLLKKLQWRLVTTGRMAYGSISNRHSQVMLLPDFTRRFGNTPYAELALGVENIFKVGRIDLVWRMTHLDPGMNPLGIRARWAFNF